MPVDEENLGAVLSNYIPGIYRMKLIDVNVYGDEPSSEVIRDIEAQLDDADEVLRSPRDFIHTWISERSGMASCVQYFSRGFELHIPAISSGGNEEGYLRVGGLPLLSDVKYLPGFGANFAVMLNDFRQSGVFTHFDEGLEGIRLDPFGIKQMHRGTLYSSSDFQFASMGEENPDIVWTMVNFSPEDMYKELHNVGFRW
ncbi:MAG: hypothetical protein ACMXYE_05160 [Candidatus Woesearchaeota archaeon]